MGKSTMDTPISFIEEKKENVLILRMHGRLDAVTASAAEQKVNEILDRGEKNILLEIADIGYISSSGIKCLLTVVKKSDDYKSHIVISSPAPSVLLMINLAGFGNVLHIVDTEEEALTQF